MPDWGVSNSEIAMITAVLFLFTFAQYFHISYTSFNVLRVINYDSQKPKKKLTKIRKFFRFKKMEYFNDSIIKDLFLQAVVWARDDPTNFFQTVFMYLTPFMILSAILR